MTMQSSKILTLAAVTCVAASAAAAPAHNVCVPMASGVPTMAGPPKWQSWGGTAPVSAALDDPRWLGATGQSFELGSAKAPLHTRAVWATEGGQTFLYLSFIVDVEGMLGATASSPRDLFVGFRRPAPVGGEAAYIFQFHLDGTAAAGLVAPAHCGRYADCAEDGTTPQNYWRVFVDQGATATCSTTGSTGQRFSRLVGATPADPPITWMADAVRYWKLGAGEPLALQNRWAVQVRFPVAAAAGQPLSAGIEPGSSFWYQATAQVAGGGGGPYVNLGHWPRELTTPICPNTSLADFLIHQELGDPDKYSSLTTFSGARPATCDKGLRISTPQIGAVFDAPLATDLSTVALNTIFKALKPDGTPGVNTVVAQVENTGATAVTAPLLARFRLAGWGAAPWSTTDPGKWKDMRKAKDGVCGAGTSPSCTPTTIAAGGKGAISFRWQLGDDPTLGASEYCQFGLTPPAGQGVCQVCSCAGSATCDAPTDPGTQSTRPGVGLWPCVSSNYHHQCMLVELSAPNGGVDFEQQSSWNNMNFGQMSVMEREALIDARGLPVAPGQKEQDIYLIAMPRVMPDKLATTSTGNELVGRRAFEAARRVIDPYRESVAQLPEEERRRLAERMKRRIPTPDDLKEDRRMRYFGEAYLALQQVRALVSPDDYQRSGRLLDLAGRAMDGQVTAEQVTHDVVDLVGPSAAAEIVPTLEIYAFYQHLGKGAVYQPMTSFSVFLSHQGPLEGITWELDGAERVGHNIYHLRIPVGFARRVQVRSQALEPGELVQAPGSKSWPCGGGCCCRDRGLLAGLGNTMPTMLGLALVGGGRRRRKAAKAAKASKAA
ncbi:MAG: hypothetical protein IPI49_10105 [Myxococcales bacterium]|nr:hypothetical protein [Myxococcales bacterium]